MKQNLCWLFKLNLDWLETPMNRRYVAGRNFEYKTKREWEEKGYLVVRSAGSKGPVDLVAIPNGQPQQHVVLLQCKRCRTRTEFERLKRDFRAKPPLDKPPSGVVMWLTVYIQDERTTEDTWL